MAVVGAVLMFVCRIVTPQSAIQSIDFGTLVLLFSMMLIVASLHLAGFFDWVANRVILHLTPRQLLPGVIFTSGILAAFLVNDVVCLFMAPLVLDVCKRMGVRPLPYLLALATASNIGGVATITGNPQNMLIGSVSGIGYRHFLAHLGSRFADRIVHRLGGDPLDSRSRRDAGRQRTALTPEQNTSHEPTQLPLLWPVFITVAVLTGFLLGIPPPLVAAAGGAMLLVRRTRDPREIYGDVDWSLLVLFLGLFLILGGAEQAGVTTTLLRSRRGAEPEQQRHICVDGGTAVEPGKQCSGSHAAQRTWFRSFVIRIPRGFCWRWRARSPATSPSPDRLPISSWWKKPAPSPTSAFWIT